MTTKFFADTYALIEIFKGNENYRLISNEHIITSTFHLAELYYYLLRSCDEALADKYFDECEENCIEISTTALKAAMKFKLINKKDRLSQADCIGYARACELGIPFLTGDSKFEGKPNVTFVK
ncbi:PIN domain-containing protein [Candidatus Woesearchaeota archaeon]|nr:PIN domain-containing protein [Candidatus Woesearchaeota archaeon]